MNNEQLEADRRAVELLNIVTTFNRTFDAWTEKYGCRVNFGWVYTHDRQVKALEVLGVYQIVYRKPPPDFERLREMVEKSQD